jgi:hypothetical protein
VLAPETGVAPVWWTPEDFRLQEDTNRPQESTPVTSPRVVYDDHHINLGLMFYTAVSSSGRASSPVPGMTRSRALVRESADM